MDRKEDLVVWEHESASIPNPFVLFCQIFSEKTATSLKSSAIVTSAVSVVFIYFSEGYRRNLEKNGHTLVSIVPVTGDEDRITEDDNARCVELADCHNIEVGLLEDMIRPALHTQHREKRLFCCIL